MTVVACFIHMAFAPSSGARPWLHVRLFSKSRHGCAIPPMFFDQAIWWIGPDVLAYKPVAGKRLLIDEVSGQWYRVHGT